MTATGFRPVHTLIIFLAGLVPSAAQTSLQADSTTVINLDEVFVTGENRVMSLSKKRFTVNVLEAETIAQLGGNTLADVLNHNLNVTVTPDASKGRSIISMFGLDGQYVNILVDGIPLSIGNGLGTLSLSPRSTWRMWSG